MEHKGEKYERLIVPILVGPSARIVSVEEEGGMRPLCASAAVVRRHGSACRSIRPRMRAMGHVSARATAWSRCGSSRPMKNG